MNVAQSENVLNGALGNPPFPHQAALLHRLLAGDISKQLDVPTGLGKTAVIAVWLVARALGAAVLRQLIRVVGRRAAVDQASSEGKLLRRWVASRTAVTAVCAAVPIWRPSTDPHQRKDVQLHVGDGGSRGE